MKKAVPSPKSFRETALELVGRLDAKLSDMWQEAKEDVKEWDMDDKIVGAGAVVAVAGSIAAFSLLSPWAAVPVLLGSAFGFFTLKEGIEEAWTKWGYAKAILFAPVAASVVTSLFSLFSYAIKNNFTDPFSNAYTTEESISTALKETQDWKPFLPFTVVHDDKTYTAIITGLKDKTERDIATGETTLSHEARATITYDTKSFLTGDPMEKSVSAKATRNGLYPSNAGAPASPEAK